jgi:hypothetical protein
MVLLRVRGSSTVVQDGPPLLLSAVAVRPSDP